MPNRCPVCFDKSPSERYTLRMQWEIREYLRQLVEKEYREPQPLRAGLVELQEHSEVETD
jgi:hypothetical protein